MSDWKQATLAEWLRATLTLREKRPETAVASLERHWGVERCTECGRTLLLGERILWLKDEGRRGALCSLCADDLRAQHLDRAA
jgi:hypothetical protein